MARPRRRYAPALTQQQFKTTRPQGNYGSYLRYLTRKRPGWDPSRPNAAQRIGPPKRGPLPSYESMLRGLSFESPAQLEARANRMMQQQVKASRGLIAEEYRAAQDDAMRRMQAFQSAGRAAAAMNAELLGRVGGGYGAAAGDISGMAGSLASAMSGATAAEVAAANQGLAAVGAGAIDPSAIGGATQAGVEAYRGGTLPAQALGTAGRAGEFGIANLISAQNLRATQEPQMAYLAAMREQGAERSRAIRELALTRPAEAAKILASFQDAQRQQYALAMSMLEGRRGTTGEKFGRGVTKQEQRRAEKQLGLQTQQFQASLKKANREAALQGREIDEARSLALGYYVDRMGRPVLKGGKQIPVPKAAKTEATGGQTPTELRRDVLYEAQRLVQNYTDRRGNILITRRELEQALRAVFPGQPGVIDRIVSSLIPKGKGGKRSGGGALGAQP